METKPPRPPKGSRLTLNPARDTLRVQRGFRFWTTPAFGAQVRVHDGARHASVVVTGRDGRAVLVRAPRSRTPDLLTWAFEFTAWNEAHHRTLGLPYPPATAAPQAR